MLKLDDCTRRTRTCHSGKVGRGRGDGGGGGELVRERRFDALMVYCLWLKIALSTRGDKINQF